MPKPVGKARRGAPQARPEPEQAPRAETPPRAPASDRAALLRKLRAAREDRARGPVLRQITNDVTQEVGRVRGSREYLALRAVLPLAMGQGPSSVLRVLERIKEWQGIVGTNVRQAWRDQARILAAQSLLATGHAFLSMCPDAEEAALHREQSQEAYLTFPVADALLDLFGAVPAQSLIDWLRQLVRRQCPGAGEQRLNDVLRSHLHDLIELAAPGAMRGAQIESSAAVPPAVAMPIVQAALDALEALPVPAKKLGKSMEFMEGYAECQTKNVVHLDDADRAIEVLTEQTRKQPNSSIPPTVLAFLHCSRNDLTSALISLKKAYQAKEQFPHNVDQQVRTLGQLLDSIEIPEASEMLATMGRNVVALFEKQHVEQNKAAQPKVKGGKTKKGQAAKSIASGKKPLEEAPRPSEANLIARRDASQTLQLVAQLQAEHTLDDVTPTLAQALRYHDLPPHLLAHFCRLAAQKLDAPTTPLQEIEALAQTLLQATKRDGPKAQACSTLLRFAERLGDKQMMTAAHIGLASVDWCSEVQRAAAAHLVRQGQRSEAAKLLQSARKRVPHDVGLLLHLAQIAAGLAVDPSDTEHGKVASSALQAVLARDPSHLQALMRLAHLSKHDATATALYQRAAEAHSDAEAAQCACDSLQAEAETLMRHQRKKLGDVWQERLDLLCERQKALVEEAGDFAPWQALMDDRAQWLRTASEAAKVAPVQSQERIPEKPSSPVAAVATNPLVTEAGEVIGLNYLDLPVVRRPDGSLQWSYIPGLGSLWRTHAPDPLTQVPPEHRHDLPAPVRAALDANLALAIAGGKTLGDYVSAILGKDDGRLCLLRGSRVHHVLLAHFAQQQPGDPRAARLLAHLAERAASDEVSDIDLGTNVPPTEVFRRCANLADVQGTFGPGGLAAHPSSQYHGACSFHDGPGAALHLDICSFITEGSLAPKTAVNGASCPVYPAVFGNCLRAWAEQQAFAPLFYDFKTGQIYDPTGLAWESLQQGWLVPASEQALANPMLPLLAAKQAPLQLQLQPDALKAVRQRAQNVQADPRLALQQLVRAAPGGLPDATALLAWARDTLGSNMRAMGLGEAHHGLLDACPEDALIAAYARRAPGFGA